MVGKTIDISIPHNLGKEAARRRIAEGAAKAHQQYASKVGNVQQSWSGDRLDFVVSALGQRVSGWLEVGEQAVQVHVLLPWLLAKLAERLRPQIESEARKALQLPPSPHSDSGRSS